MLSTSDHQLPLLCLRGLRPALAMSNMLEFPNLSTQLVRESNADPDVKISPCFRIGKDIIHSA